jgi:hypothetical protein
MATAAVSTFGARPTSRAKVVKQVKQEFDVVKTASVSRAARLSDPDVSASVDALKARLMSDPELAKKWLRELGYLTAGGNVSSRYGSR